MGGTGDAAVPIGTAAMRYAAAAGKPPAQCTGERHPEDAGRVLRLALRNPSQHCYINSFVLSYLWTHCLLKAPEAQLFGDHIQAWRDVLYGPMRTTIYGMPSWSRLFRGWSMPASQHDVAEFQLHIMEPLLLNGEWQSRQLAGPESVITSDRGCLSAPIVLHLGLASSSDSLQGCVDRWHKQARATNGLLKDYDVVFLQLARYDCNAGIARKDRTRVQLATKIALRVFGRGLKTFRATYTVSSIITHHGDSPTTGHYNALLLEPSALPRGSCWETNDDRPARHCSSLPLYAETDGYVFILTRCRLS